MFVRKSVVSVKIFARNSGAGNGCTNFMGAWKNCVLSSGKTHAYKIPRFWGGGGYFGFFGGGRVADSILMGARKFLSLGSWWGDSLDS